MKKSIAIIGGGAAALMLANFLDDQLFDISIYEKNKALGRKLLVAGKGGFNLTHSENLESFKNNYTPIGFLDSALNFFSNEDLRNWLQKIGIATFIGSSKRIFPIKGIKPIAVLNAMQKDLVQKNVKFYFEHSWKGWNPKNHLLFNDDIPINPDITVFALGGGSWKITGSDGTWLETFKAKGIQTKPFVASNCGFKIDWEKDFISQHEGSPLKNIALSAQGASQKGEVVITKFGMEGNAIYALSNVLQAQLSINGQAKLFLDLKPILSAEKIKNKLLQSQEKNISNALKRELKLNKAHIHLLKLSTSKAEFQDIPQLAKIIKAIPLKIIGSATIDEAISTMGGIDLNSINENFELKKMKKTFCIGEMLDWNAPTGGYLLQACFSMAVYLADYLNHHES